MNKIIAFLLTLFASYSITAMDTPLMQAVKSAGENIPLCQLLLDQGANINEFSGNDGYTPLMQAALDGRMQLCKFLLDHGANILARDRANNTALLLVAQKYYRARIGNKYITPDPLVSEIMMNLQRTVWFFLEYQELQEKTMFTWLACLKYHEMASMKELYRQRDKLFINHLKQYLVKPLLEAKNNERKCLDNYQ